MTDRCRALLALTAASRAYTRAIGHTSHAARLQWLAALDALRAIDNPKEA